MKVVATRGYDRRAAKLFTPAERAAAHLLRRYSQRRALSARYAKNAKEDLSDGEEHEIRKLIAAIEAQG
jgi:uncharacterized protein YqeY